MLLLVLGGGIGISYAIFHENPTPTPTPPVVQPYISAYSVGVLQIGVDASSNYFDVVSEGVTLPTDGSATGISGLPNGVIPAWALENRIFLFGTPDEDNEVKDYEVTISVGDVSTKTSITLIAAPIPEPKISYAIINGQTVNFYADTTPISNFCNNDDNININGETVEKTTISEIGFGDDYSHIKTIDEYFITGFDNLVKIDFSGLKSLTSVGMGWLANCVNLESADFSSLTNLETVDGAWLMYCFKLQHVNFSNLNKLETVSTYWLTGCPALEEADFSGLTNLTTVGGCWLSDCVGLKTVNFSNLTKLTEVGERWLCNCQSLESVDFSDLINLTTVYESWLHGATSLTSINFSNLTKLAWVGHGWLFESTSLVSVNFSNLESLETVGNWWLGGCSSLKSVNFNGLSNLKTVGEGWLAFCTSLENIDISDLSSLTTVGAGWLASGSDAFTSITVGDLTWNESDFSSQSFADHANNSGTIYCKTTIGGETWKKGGLSNWEVVEEV